MFIYYEDRIPSVASDESAVGLERDDRMSEFKDKVVVVTGGANGIGKCITEEFRKEGVRYMFVLLVRYKCKQGCRDRYYEAIFIICDDEKLTRKLGEDHGTVILSFPTEAHYICISDEYLELDILAHEITHAELHTRLSAEAQKAIPTWFDEGIALQNDYREKYSEAQWTQQTDNGKNAVALEDMDTPAEFYAGEAEDRRFRYLNAKHELDVWMTSHGQQGLLELLDRLNGGADFTTAYEG